MEQGFLQPDLLMERGDVLCWLPLWLAVTAEKSLAPAGKPAPLKQAAPAPQQAAHAAVANGVSCAVSYHLLGIFPCMEFSISRAGEAAHHIPGKPQSMLSMYEKVPALYLQKAGADEQRVLNCAGEGFVTADIDMEERSDDFAAVLDMERAAGHVLSLMVRALCCSANSLLTMEGAV